jgi:hypothetical protein
MPTERKKGRVPMVRSSRNAKITLSSWRLQDSSTWTSRRISSSVGWIQVFVPVTNRGKMLGSRMNAPARVVGGLRRLVGPDQLPRRALLSLVDLHLVPLLHPPIQRLLTRLIREMLMKISLTWANFNRRWRCYPASLSFLVQGYKERTETLPDRRSLHLSLSFTRHKED